MDPTTQSPNQNGHHPAPLPTSSGALYSSAAAAAAGVAQRPAPSTFPAEVVGWSPRLLSSWLGWAQWGDIALIRWLWVAGVILSIGLAIAPIPYKMWLIALLLGSLTVISLARPLIAQSHFVKFVATVAEGAPNDAENSPLAPAQKIPVYVTGILDVNGRQQRFVALPGFYRTFATREHALICQCRDRRILGIGVPPERDLGLWYAFFDGGALQQIERGTIAPGGTPLPTLRVLYQARHSKKRGPSSTLDTLYISTSSSDDLARIEADLRFDWDGATSKYPSTQASLPAKAKV